MPSQTKVRYRFGDCLVDPTERQVLRGGKPVPLQPKVFDSLLILLESQSRLVEKDEFLSRLWPDSCVEEVALAHCISQLRKSLEHGTGERRLIETVPKRGYRFVAPVEVIKPVPDDLPTFVRIAVLPFEILDGSSEREYLANGFTEETIAALGQIDPERVSVIGRTTVMTYKGTRKTLLEISSELNAAYLVESSIRQEGGQLRIMSRLVRGLDQAQVWTASYDSELSSMLTFQQELGTAIAEQIRLHLSPERLSAVLSRRQTRSAEAYDEYLRGRYLWNQLSPATTRRSVEHYKRATTLDPGYALAWSGLADAWAASPINGDAPPLQVWPRAREAAARAVKAEPSLAEAQTSLGVVAFFLDWDWAAAEEAFRRGIALDPGYCIAHRTLGILLSHSRRHEEAHVAAGRACTLEPLHAAHHALSAQVAFNAGDYASAVKFARHAIVVDPGFWVGHLQIAQALQQSGDADLALEALQNAWQSGGGNSKVIALRAYILARLGRAQEAKEILSTLEGLPPERYVPPYAKALIHAGLGNRKEALGWLERAYEMHDVHLLFLLVDPKWDEFRAEVRFLSVLDRCAFVRPLPGTRSSFVDRERRDKGFVDIHDR